MWLLFVSFLAVLGILSLLWRELHRAPTAYQDASGFNVTGREVSPAKRVAGGSNRVKYPVIIGEPHRVGLG